VPRIMPATSRPLDMTSIIANSSATRTGLRIGTVGPRTAIFARFTTWHSAPAMTMGFGKPDPKAFADVKPGDTVHFEFGPGGPMGYQLKSVHRMGAAK